VINISENGARLALLDSVREEDERTLRRQIERLREKQAELHRIQREAKNLAQAILVVQRNIAAITDEMAILAARRSS
jgi:predicted  nucleic acid-binding Zn-ribbon protein